MNERRAIASLAKDDAIFIDIGANIGLYSFSLAAAFKNYKNTKILAIEPHPIISRRLAFNLSLNPDLPIEPIIVGLGARDGVKKMITPGNNLGESRVLKMMVKLLQAKYMKLKSKHCSGFWQKKVLNASTE